MKLSTIKASIKGSMNKGSMKNRTITSTLATVMMITTPMATMLISPSATAATPSKKPASSEQAAKNFNKLVAKMNTMTASFSQKTIKGKNSSKGKLLTGNTKFTGKMSVKRPGMFRWNVTSPAQQLTIVNGDNVWVYEKDLNQVFQQNVKSQIGDTPAVLFSGDYKKISNNFKVTQPSDNKSYFELYPKANDAKFKSILMSFRAGKPAMIVLNDNLGQTTSIKLNNVQLNPKISSSQFKFKAPKGVEIIQQ